MGEIIDIKKVKEYREDKTLLNKQHSKLMDIMECLDEEADLTVLRDYVISTLDVYLDMRRFMEMRETRNGNTSNISR